MKRKKWTAFILSATMVFTCCATAFAQDEAENIPAQTDAVQESTEITELPETDMLKTAENAGAPEADVPEEAAETETPEADVPEEAAEAEAPETNVQDEAEETDATDADVQDEAAPANAGAEAAELQPLYKTDDAATETMETDSENTLILASDKVDNGYYQISAWLKDGKDQVAVGDAIDLSTDLEYEIEYCLEEADGCITYEKINIADTDMRIRLAYADGYLWDYAENSDADALLPTLKRTSAEKSIFEIDLEKLNEQGEWECIDYSIVTVYSVNYDITYEAYYGETRTDCKLFYDNEAVFELSTTGYSYDLPEGSRVEWVINDNYETTTVYTDIDDPLRLTPSKQGNYDSSVVYITANVCYTDSDTDIENQIATYFNFFTVYADGQSYACMNLGDNTIEDFSILVGETMDFATAANVYSITYSPQYPDGYTAKAEIVNLQVTANYIPTYDENGNEDEWIQESLIDSGTLEEKIVHIDGTTVTGLAYGQVCISYTIKDENGKELSEGFYFNVDPNPDTETPTDDNKTTPAAGGSAVNTNNTDSATAAANTGSTDTAAATASTGSTDSAASPKTSDVNYMRYIILLLAAFGTLTALSVKARKKTN